MIFWGRNIARCVFGESWEGREREGERDDKKQEFLREWKAIPWNGAHKEILLSNCYQNFLRLVYPKKCSWCLLFSLFGIIQIFQLRSENDWENLGKPCHCSIMPSNFLYAAVLALWVANVSIEMQTPRIWRWLCAASIRESLYCKARAYISWWSNIENSFLDTCQDCWCENVIWFILHRLHLLRGKSLALMDWGGGWKLNDISCASL